MILGHEMFEYEFCTHTLIVQSECSIYCTHTLIVQSECSIYCTHTLIV